MTKKSEMGPVISADHKENVIGWINKGIEEGPVWYLMAEPSLAKGYENGFILAPTILDHVEPGMTVCVRRFSGRCCV